MMGAGLRFILQIKINVNSVIQDDTTFKKLAWAHALNAISPPTLITTPILCYSKYTCSVTSGSCL